MSDNLEYIKGITDPYCDLHLTQKLKIKLRIIFTLYLNCWRRGSVYGWSLHKVNLNSTIEEAAQQDLQVNVLGRSRVKFLLLSKACLVGRV